MTIALCCYAYATVYQHNHSHGETVLSNHGMPSKKSPSVKIQALAVAAATLALAAPALPAHANGQQQLRRATSGQYPCNGLGTRRHMA